MIEDAPLRTILKSQYHAALAMLRHGVELCPEAIWTGTGHRNEVWQIAYHTLFFTHLYMQVEDAAFRPWEKHRAENQYPDGIAGPPDPESDLPLLPEPYSREEVLAYCDECDDMVDGAVDAMDLASEESGFHWYPIPEHFRSETRFSTEGADAPGMQGVRRDQPLAGCDRRSTQQPGMQRPPNASLFPDGSAYW